jgi:serine/threonine protein kinase
VPSPPLIPGLRMGELLGEGASGTVYAAVNAQGDELAVKFLRESLADSPKMVLRLRREASTAQHLRSEYIAQVVSAGRTDDLYWIADRRLHGETLASRLRRETMLEPAALVTLIEQVLRGLAVAHDAGVVHRDINPANIMIERPSRVHHGLRDLEEPDGRHGRLGRGRVDRDDARRLHHRGLGGRSRRWRGRRFGRRRHALGTGDLVVGDAQGARALAPLAHERPPLRMSAWP